MQSLRSSALEPTRSELAALGRGRAIVRLMPVYGLPILTVLLIVVFRSVQRHLGITLSGATITVRADVADEKLATALDYEVGRPILVIEMLYRSADGEPVELTINRNRADLFSLSYEAPNDLV